MKYLLGDRDGFSVDGAVGLRVVKTKLEINGISPFNVPTTYAQSYTDWLPNVSARAHLTDQVQLLGSYTETRTRPSFSQYNPGTFINPQSSGGAIQNGGRGNLNLWPFNSDNYDLSLEYYFGRASSLTGSLFRRNVTGFIQNTNTDIVDPVLGTVRISQPQNTRDGRIQGFELAAQTLLDVVGLPDWTSAFGVQANITYLDGSDDIIGISELSWNVAAFYEKNRSNSRLSYNYRFHYLTRVDARGADTYSETVGSVGRLDFSSSYDVSRT